MNGLLPLHPHPNLSQVREVLETGQREVDPQYRTSTVFVTIFL